MNLATIYAVDRRGMVPPSGVLRLSMLYDEFEECGYWVMFRPYRALGRVIFRVRRALTENEVEGLRDLVAEAGPCRAVVERVDGVWDRDRTGESWKDEGTVQGGVFALDVYAAEEFSRRLAEFLARWHEDKGSWIFNDDTK
jgi:hypothetical protein